MIDVIARLSYTLALPLVQHIVLQAKGLVIDFFKDVKKERVLLLASLEVLYGWVLVEVILVHVALLEFSIVLDALHNLIGLVLDLTSFFDACPLKQSLELALFNLHWQLRLAPRHRDFNHLFCLRPILDRLRLCLLYLTLGLEGS